VYDGDRESTRETTLKFLHRSVEERCAKESVSRVMVLEDKMPS